ncbi:hypothetical protein BD410DRAFT_805898 [Rickenella mellea]|uniref:Glycosyl hydrolase family 92 domain-containing protein n=1 Tax=Rickenella mellea TaxID=50990 RepID=A0A4Y7PWA0_9AGAM|nr:hypothetical protein BD410DRAFT_805898 [Rickenella mellea]
MIYFRTFSVANGHKVVVLILLKHGAHHSRADRHDVTSEILAATMIGSNTLALSSVGGWSGMAVLCPRRLFAIRIRCLMVVMGQSTHIIANDRLLEQLHQDFDCAITNHLQVALRRNNILTSQRLLGENPRWTSTEPYYDSLYHNWDTYRTLYSLYSLHDPVTFSRVVRGMIDIQQHEAQKCIQGGSSEFFVKFNEHATALNVSATDLYNSLLIDAEVQPPNWDLQGRQANVWKSLGTERYQHKTGIEKARAQILGKADDVAKYKKRAGNFNNVWNPGVTVPDGPGIKGMMQDWDTLVVFTILMPRFANGEFGFTDPHHCSINEPKSSTCFLDAHNTDGFYKASSLVYSQVRYVSQETAKLIALQGGNQNFLSRLDFIIDQLSGRNRSSLFKGFFDVLDEPLHSRSHTCITMPTSQGLSTQRSRQVIAEHSDVTHDGLPGNDDSATKQYLLFSPYFPRVSYFNPLFNSTTTIKANAFKGNPKNGTSGTVFVQSVKVNGLPKRRRNPGVSQGFFLLVADGWRRC